MSDGWVLVEDGPGGEPAVFAAPRRVVVACSPEEVAPALAALDAARAAGLWVAGWIGYEAGHVLEPRLRPGFRAPEGPLLAFGLFDRPLPAAGWLEGAAAGNLTRPEPMVTRAQYQAAFDRVAAYIAAGDIYQVNLTFPMAARWSGDARGLYAALRARQSVPHGGMADLGEGPVVLSRSPELFLRVAGDAVETRPMKGTAPRDPDPQRDAALAQALRDSDKGQAENLMIVDLLRNDLSRVCAVGSVRVPALFHVQSYATVHQMISRVVGRLRPGQGGMAPLMAALFPCGSVTGAPKIRAMEIIREVEPLPRGAYCGALGWMAPGGDASFNVTIRTVSLFPDGRAVLNVGGGVVADSTAAGEWEEALWKARFATLT
ncbi:MAG: aminodeoxychorismate synthase component I [Gemmobacter sp.]|uniref:aminodeoxychorismate synthase component I n=1 Tax=Gemmobacter sp. TaxID=1898957 RepID=UPI00391A725D